MRWGRARNQPPGRTRSHSLPRILSTTVGRHKLKRSRSSFSDPTACAAGTSPERGGMVCATKALLKGKLPLEATEGFPADGFSGRTFQRGVREIPLVSFVERKGDNRPVKSPSGKGGWLGESACSCEEVS